MFHFIQFELEIRQILLITYNKKTPYVGGKKKQFSINNYALETIF